MDLVWKEVSHLHHHHHRHQFHLYKDFFLKTKISLKKISVYEFNICFSCRCCFVLLISCLSLPCSVDNDCKSLLRSCNDRPITSSLKRTPLLLLLR